PHRANSAPCGNRTHDLLAVRRQCKQCKQLSHRAKDTPIQSVVGALVQFYGISSLYLLIVADYCIIVCVYLRFVCVCVCVCVWCSLNLKWGTKGKKETKTPRVCVCVCVCREKDRHCLCHNLCVCV